MRHDQIVRSLEELDDEGNSADPRWWAPGTYEELLVAARTDDVPIYISHPKHYLYGVVVEAERLKGAYVADLLDWNFHIPSGAGWSCVSDGRSTWGEPYRGLDYSSTKRLDQGTPLLFMRHDRRPGFHGIEPNQLLTHTLDLYDDGGGRWVRRNELGEWPSVMRITGDGDRLVSLERGALDEYLAVSSSCLVRVFDVKKWVGSVGHMADRSTTIVRRTKEKLFYRLIESEMEGHSVVMLRGFDVIRPDPACRRRALQRLSGEGPREYATFLILDFKHQREVEWPADERKLGNYFTESPHPYATSPAFFKPTVLLQYRAEPERFTVHPERVDCHGGWSIPYDINESGQVHAYICDLAHLPHAEQLRWKAHNERPNGTVSRRAYVQDFLGQFSHIDDPVYSLQEIASAFPSAGPDGVPCQLWSCGPDIDHVGLVVTASSKEFKDQLLLLTKVVVEGLDAGTINKLSKHVGCRDPQLGPIRQLERLLTALGVDNAARDAIIAPMAELQKLRSSVAAHRGGGSICDQRKPFRDLLERCTLALRGLASLVTAGTFVPASHSERSQRK